MFGPIRRASLAVLLLGAALPAAADGDDHQPLTLSAAQRGHVLAEMRALLTGTQKILSALAEGDLPAVARHARPLGLQMAHKAEDHLRGVLPEAFMRLGESVHADFDQMAADAEAGKGSTHALRRLSDTLGKCVACHATYRIQAESTVPAEHAAHHAH